MKLSLKTKILAMSVVPVIVLGVVVIVMALTSVKSSLVDEIQESLKGTAAATLAAYNQNSGEYRQASNGDVWKGSFNISKSESLVDNIKESTGMDVTFFFGSERIMSSAVDKNGDRIIGSPAGDIIVEKVLNNGEEYFSENVSLDGEMNYGYFIPVYQTNSTDDIVGIIFIGTNKAEKDAKINQIVMAIVAGVLIITVIFAAIAAVITISITNSIKKGIDIVQEVSKGELNVNIDRKLMSRTDEIGALSKSISQLQTELKGIINRISSSSERLALQAGELASTSKDTNDIMRQVESAVNTITDNATEQAGSTRITSDNVYEMGNHIGETSKEVGVLNTNADAMRRSSEEAAVTLKQLRSINDEVEKSIEAVSRQTNQANESARKIREATELIANIAEETNLLSLNASIEAARAGESGKGFAVVAGQIQKLAEQSNESSRTIEEITNALINDSDVTVEAMNHVKEIVDSQSKNMIATEKIMSEVIEGINTSLKSIEQIDTTTRRLDKSRNAIVDTVENLSQIAQQNAASTQETLSQTAQMSNTFGLIEESAGNLKDISDELSDTMKHFRL
jgi:methyl-accepting chemotaxis protein